MRDGLAPCVERENGIAPFEVAETARAISSCFYNNSEHRLLLVHLTISLMVISSGCPMPPMILVEKST